MAITRARRHVAVICDSRTIGNHSFLKRLVDYMSEHGEVRTAFEYLDDIVPENYFHKSSQGVREQERKPKLNAARADSVNPRGKLAKQAGEKLVERSVQSEVKVTAKQTEVMENLSKHQAKILAFLESNETQLDFPPSLNAHDRLLIHQLAEEHGLQHVSTGEGGERYISIRKRDAAIDLSPRDSPAFEQELCNRSSSPPKEVPVEGEERRCSTNTGKVDLKALHLERVQREKARRGDSTKQRHELNANLQEVTGKKHRNEGKGISLALFGFDFLKPFAFISYTFLICILDGVLLLLKYFLSSPCLLLVLNCSAECYFFHFRSPADSLWGDSYGYLLGNFNQGNRP